MPVFLFVENVLPLAEAKGIELGVDADDAITLFMPEVDMETLVRNLLDNAVRYTPRGGKAELLVGKTAHAVVIEVEDSGPGIPEQERARVFDSFYRILGSEQEGSGLGLAIVKTIVDRLHGSIELSDARQQTPPGLKVMICFSA